MKTDETKAGQGNGLTNSGTGGMSRREFVERLRRTAIFGAPVVAALALKAPKAMGQRTGG
jgi:hypothetical protein